MKRSKSNAETQSVRRVKELLRQMPITNQDRGWNREEAVLEAFRAAGRVFAKHIKGHLKVDKVTKDA